MESFLYSGTQLLAQHTAEGEASEHHGPELATSLHHVSYTGLFIYVGLVVVLLFLFMAIAKKGFSKRTFTGYLTQRFEHLFYFIENLCVGIIGPHGRKYLPMIMTFWLVIFVSNLVALFMSTSPTADLSFNLAMALMAVFYVQWEGIKANGVLGHFKHFAGPIMPGALILINLMLFAIELVSEMMKNLSLSLRLFGNIDGGHKAAEGMNALGKGLFMMGDTPFNLPFGAFLVPVKLLTCVVQAMIFCLLLCVYLSLVTHHDHDHGDDHEHDHEHEGHGETAAAH